ncbi:bifunctional hydroxymethylpyrimidine kinase/phosphomethylpyrimidine kinase [uncultured Rikenella sp.]|uniref:bifunctional hydroxymethylpyrimidine kinase/phosphomethylpyrimidine kinase n=1 Tax=uncultured Rikenella sp. TaxID=368003 RepID=UPI0026133162|nr:bifunctional hydroxymethylpyrimidine kinase/phosphomethylpyrimidine kinase [uncultured Rikenella sp.]
MKRILTIAGSDSGGGAGIQTDIKTISALGGYASSVLTAVTAQNTRGVTDVEFLSPDIVEKQLRAVLDDIGTDAVKIGMLGTREVVERVAKLLEAYRPPIIVLDPVLVATSGDVLTAGSATEAIVHRLMPLATVVTPNIPEAQRLTGLSIASPDDYEAVWERFRAMGAQAVLLKGGHLTGDRLTDTLFSTGDPTAHAYTHARIETRNTHGTGCTLSSALAVYLAMGLPLAEATGEATDFIHDAIVAARDRSIGSGHGPVDPFFAFNR